jgi:hypothetical protein
MVAAKGKTFVERVSTPGWRRRITIATMVIVIVAICVALASYTAWEGVSAALVIFLVSALGFSLVAAISYDSAVCWRLVDAFWVCGSFAAVVVALINIDEAASRQQISNARSEVTDLFSGLLFAVQSIVTNDCEESPAAWDVRPRSPEPYKGACDQLKHLIPEMSYQYDEFSRTNKVSFLKIGAQVCVTGATVGSWASLNDRATRFIQTADRLSPILEGDRKRDPLHQFIVSTELRYWYFFMAFFVGLRLSRTTADILQMRASHHHPTIASVAPYDDRHIAVLDRAD